MSDTLPARSFKALQWGVSVAVLVGGLILALLVYVISEVRFEPIKIKGDKHLLIVPSGQGLNELAADLEASGLIDSGWKFNAYARTSLGEQHILAGEYFVKRGDTVRDLLQRLRDGDVATYRLTLIEGWRMEDVMAHLSRNSRLALDEELPSIESLGTWLGLPWAHGEGSVLPDTYVYTSYERGEDLLRRAAEALESELARAWEGRDLDLALATPYELLILASIIEKESGTPSDSFRISRVFANRLEASMRLQADPTVIYGLGDAFAGDLLRIHLREDTPYNTYTRHGLPPSPIALVSRHSLYAAAKPRKGPWKYFVARGDGSSEFSTSLTEHNRAVREFVKRR
ncbi:MAG: endolytic transglycosylase MltG [Gammaproteobacteria bacterium]|nr:endolytic transglycosylase MltG [Gammaproteobacteria bacterium]